MNRSGIIFIILSIFLSVTNALNINGTIIEQILGFFSQLVTFFLLIALFGAWKGKKLFHHNHLRLIAYSYPFLLLLVPIYQNFEYSEQEMPWSYIYMQTLEFIFALFILSTLEKETK